MHQTDSLESSIVVPPFRHLPQYAKFLLEEKLTEFFQYGLQLSRDIKVPLLRYFDALPEEQLVAIGIEGNRQLLTAMIENRLTEYIRENLRIWKENQLPLVGSDDVVIEDISKVNFVRRSSFRQFLPAYCQDQAVYVAIMEEVDKFTLIQEEVNYKTLFEMKERKIHEHLHFINKINNASPGIIYVYDVVARRQIYSNHKAEELLGYTTHDFKSMGDSLGSRIIHPDDREALSDHLLAMKSAADGVLRTVEFRVQNKQGRYVWQRAYETVFRRGDDHSVHEIIGISLDVTQEKESLTQLAQREQQLREAQEIAGMGSFEWDLQGAESVFSPQLLHIFELEEKSNLPDFLQFVHPGDRDMVKRAIADALNGIIPVYECEYRYRRNGPEKVIWSRGRVVFEQGRALRMKGTVMDVTQRHDMLKRLARSEQLHKQAQALTHLGNWSWSLADNKVAWSDEMYRIFGIEPQSEHITFDRVEGSIHPSDRGRIRQALHDALTAQKAEDYLMRLVMKDDTIKYIEGKTEILCDENGKPYKLAGTCQDITEHYLLNERLKENELASRQLINGAPEGIVVINQDSQILLWNPKAEAIFGWTEQEIAGKTLMETIIPPQYRERHAKGISRLPANGDSKVLNQSIEIEALKKSGEVFFISLNISQSLRGGQPVYIAFIRDISQEKAIALQLEEQRNQLTLQNRALERSNQELTAFNYISSHDLKEPVRKIKVFSNLITTNSEEPLTARQRDSMNRIITAASHMERLIEALIVFSRTSAGERKFEQVDLAETVADVEYALKDRIEESGAVISAGALPTIRAISFQIQQLFENIIGNALKYSKPDVAPRITIAAKQISGRELPQAGADPELRYHHISVSDNGIGFEQQYAEKVFEVFQRLHGKELYSGTGIGLAICKKIVQHHDGFIVANSSPGQGTTFSIYLPDRGV